MKNNIMTSTARNPRRGNSDNDDENESNQRDGGSLQEDIENVLSLGINPRISFNNRLAETLFIC